MSRSTQAYKLGRHLSELTGVKVELVYHSGAKWTVQWPGGPTRDEMRTLVNATIAKHPYHFGLMADREISTSRVESARAWAARAVAARRDGSLAEETRHGADRRRELGVDRLWLSTVGADNKPMEYFALLDLIERRIETTSYPERPSEEADVPLIEQLLAAGKRDTYKMADILVNELLTPEPGAGPALRSVDTADRT